MNMRDLIDRLDQLKEAADFAGGWPASKAEVQAFQTAQGITPVDGLIGKNTMAALTAAGAVPPAGFVPVGQKQSTQSKVKAANAAYVANQAKAPQGDQTAGGKTNAAFLPGAAGGAAPAADSGPSQADIDAAAAANTANAADVAAKVKAQQDAATAAAGAAKAAASTVPGTAPAAGGATNPWAGTDPAKAAAWAALSPEDQKWIGKADPTDKIILARAPSKGGFVGSITPNFMKKKEPAATAPAAAPAPAAPAPGPALGTQPAMSESSEFQRMLDLAGIKPQANVAEHKKKDSEILTEAPLIPPGAGAAAAAAAAKYGGKAVNWLKNKISPEIHPPTGPIRTAAGGATMSKAEAEAATATSKALASEDQRQFAAELHDATMKVKKGEISAKSFLRQLMVGIGGKIGFWTPLLIGSIATMFQFRDNPDQTFTEWATECGIEIGSDIYNATLDYIEKNDAVRAQAADMAKKGASEQDIAKMLISQHKYGSSNAQRTAREMVNAHGGKAAAASTAAPAATTDKAAAPAAAPTAAPAAKAPAASPAPAPAAPAAAPAANSTPQKIQNRSSEWDLNPENSWSGAGRKPTQESAYRIFVKNPHTGVISEVTSLPTQSIKKTSKTNYFESYDCTVDSVNVQSTWQINVWTNEPISKLLKGQKQ